MKHIIVIDNFDSFTFNLVDYLKLCGVKVTVFRNTTPLATLVVAKPSAMVYSPGPGNPRQAGRLLNYIVKFAPQVPQLGVCLGMQAMIEVYGGSLRVLCQPMHGKESLVQHNGLGIFQGVPNPVAVGRYHSLAADIVPETLLVTATTHDLANGEVVMAVQHRTLPTAGVQFHPESVLTMKQQAGLQMIRNYVNSI